MNHVEAQDARAKPAELPALLLKAMRPKQWTKNLIALAPLLFAQKAHEMPLVLAALTCVAALCLVSGGIYILNDVADAETDRAHPVKSRRPIASGKLDIRLATVFGVFVLTLGLFLSYLLRPTLLLVFLVFVAMNVCYSLWLKHFAIIDVFTIAASFVLRAVAGAIAVKVPISAWFLLVTSLGALFLSLEKRRKELQVLKEDSATHRRALGTYSVDLIDRMQAVVTPSLLTSYAFYSFLSVHGQWMMLTVPFVLYGVMRYQLLSTEKDITGSPEEVLLKDRPTQVTLLLWLLTSALVVYNAQALLPLVSRTLDSLDLFP